MLPQNDNIKWTEKDLEKSNQSELRHQKKLKKALIKAEKLKNKEEIRKIKYQFKKEKPWKSRMTTTKRLMYFIVLNCTIIEIYSMYIMAHLQDLSSLYSLIGAVVGESISYAIYCAKSFNETKEEVRSQLERDRFNAEYGLTDEEREEVDNLVPDPIPEDDDHSGDIPDGVIMEEDHD